MFSDFWVDRVAANLATCSIFRVRKIKQETKKKGRKTLQHVR